MSRAPSAVSPDAAPEPASATAGPSDSLSAAGDLDSETADAATVMTTERSVRRTPDFASDANLSLQFADSVRPPKSRTLAGLRWVAIIGQTMALLIATYVIGLELPFLACALTIAAAAAFNTAVSLSPNRNRRLTDRNALLMLVFDLWQLSTLLFLTGGLRNPFALFLLGPVTISATVLSLRATLTLGALSIFAATFLSQFSLPLTLPGGERLEPHALSLAGFWAAIALGVATQAIYARRISLEAFKMSAALGATQSALERERRLAAIGALAAAAAHELGTPLATIKLVASELRDELKQKPELREDAELISEQARRCSEILARLSALRSPEEHHLQTAPIVTVAAEAAEPHQLRRSDVIFRINGVVVDPAETQIPQPEIPRRPEIIHGLRNLVQNAVDFAASRVWIDIMTDARRVRVRIGDDGAGFSEEILATIGEPFATTRGRSARNGEAEYLGMGLGVFIAITLLERTGATLTFSNSRARRPAGGAVPDQPIGALVEVDWPREALGLEPTRSA